MTAISSRGGRAFHAIYSRLRSCKNNHLFAGLRHDGRRQGHAALRRTEAEDRHCPGVDKEPQNTVVGRGHVRSGHRKRKGERQNVISKRRRVVGRIRTATVTDPTGSPTRLAARRERVLFLSFRRFAVATVVRTR